MDTEKATPLELSLAPEGWAHAIEAVLADPRMLRAHVQPIVDLKRGLVAGYELLARFDHPLGGSPAQWFAAAGELGYVEELDALVFRAACRLLPELPPNTFLSVNVTGLGVTSTAVREAMHECAPLERLVVEITEQTEIDDQDRLGAVAAELRERGAMIAIDDAGAGYANLQRILSVRPEFIKLDRSLVADLHRDEAKAAATEMMGALANRMDSWIVAEGVERLAELDRLLELGVPLAQGYLFARPGPGFVSVDASWASRAPARDRADLLVGLIEAVRPALEAAEIQEIGWRFSDDEMLDHLPVTDARGRPVRLLERDTGVARPILRVDGSGTPKDLLRRAMTRPREQRLTPLVCCDEGGRYRGLIRVERLVAALG